MQNQRPCFAYVRRTGAHPPRFSIGRSPKALAALAAAVALIDSPAQLNATTVTSTWTGASSSAWSTAANWNPSTNYPNNGNGGVSDYDVVIPSDPNQPTISADTTIDGLSIGSNATLTIPGFDMTVNSSAVDNGTIILNSSGEFFSHLYFEDSSLSGTGVITLNGFADDDNTFSTAEVAGTLTVGSTNTIQGFGGIDAVLTNNGVINANVSGGVVVVLLAPTNNNLMEATAGGELSLANLTQGGSGQVLATGSGSSVVLDDAIISGGTIATSSGGVIDVEDTVTLANVTNKGSISISDFCELNITGNLVDDGTITVNSQSNINGPSTMTFNGGTLSGTGTIALNSSALSAVLAGTLTQSAGHTIAGFGTITASITNQGLIDANNGTIQLSNATINGGTLSGVIETITNSNTLAGVTNAGTLIVSASNLNISGTLVDDGSVVVGVNDTGDASLTFNGGTLSGTGTGALTGIGSFLEGTLTQSAGHTISGSGVIYADLINNGLILGGLYISGETITNSSTIGSAGATTTLAGGVLVNNVGGVIYGNVTLSTATITGGILGTSTSNFHTNPTVTNSNTLNGVTLDGTLNVSTGSTVTTTQTTTNKGTISVDHATLIVQGPLDGIGTVMLSTGGVLNFASSIGTSTEGTLIITGTGQMDLNNNGLFIIYGSNPDPVSSIAAWIKSGYNNGSWNGPGIMSSAAAANSLSYGLGYADSADPGNPANLSSGTIEIKYTLLGDANLDGIVNGIDFGILAANFNHGVTGWDKGDFNYDNIVNGIDFGELAANFNHGASGASFGPGPLSDPALVAFAEANGLMADVPEPASTGLLALGAVGILARRRRANQSVRE
jgi:hypothetical protein